MSMTNVIKEYQLYLTYVETFKKELDELDEANWYEGPEYYKFNGFNPNKKTTEDPDKELELLRSMLDGGVLNYTQFTFPGGRGGRG
ncbi:hypothetical protein MPVG_00055 [Micromonas pusilla virus 12T]|uniref:hypothetical protein n=1 Tax=Micromonas pusilla virus 12T TaxID=755272 RepID=UPI0002C06A8B|nr:hypothetical protein MPVG_00055 [Micromonas pusilla virus 12T]AGH30878.1 hypothetical protein MPVG_00055 [Micromonas pusilla virus 12T]